METTTGQAATTGTETPSDPIARQGSPRLGGRRRGLVVVAAVAAGAALLALWQHWLTITDLVPLLFVLPCAAMMFMCLKGMNHGQQDGTVQASTPKETTTVTEVRN
jgi:hypothetical protein